MASLEPYRRSISGSAVAPLWVVEHLDVVEDIGLGCIACQMNLAADAFALDLTAAEKNQVKAAADRALLANNWEEIVR